MAGTFLNECPRWMSELRGAVEAGNAPQVRMTAHTLRGALSTLASRRAESAAQRLETLGRQNNLSGGAAVFADLSVEIDRLTRALAAFTHPDAAVAP
jgi:HPt (histidine-containing phosphotransfer) domain-containing protein